MRLPLAAWRAGTRWPLVLVAGVALLVIAVAVCEAIGWPFLVTPVEHWLATTLDRRVAFAREAPDGDGGVRIGLIGSVRVSVPSIEVGAPAWSAAPRMLIAHGARLKLGYLDLWRAWRGEPLHVEALDAAELDAALERLADGRASWQFGRRKTTDGSARPAALPSFGELRVGDGHLVFDDAILPSVIDARFALSDDGAAAAQFIAAAAASAPAPWAASGGIVVRAGGAAASAVAERVVLAPGESGLVLKAIGRYRQMPVYIDLRTAGVLGFGAEGKDATPQPLRLLATIGRAELSFQGSTTDPLHLAGLKGKFSLAGPSLAAVGDPLGITLPTTPAFRTHGAIAKDGGLWKAVVEDATIGSSRLDGAFTFDRRPAVPLLAGRLGGSRLVLADLGPALGAPAPGQPASASAAAKERVIPDRQFDLPSLRAMDANVLIDIAMFDPGTTVIEPLRPARAHLLLAGGVLTIADVEGSTAQGRLLGYVQLDGRGAQALWTADLRALGIDMAQWLRLKRAADSPPYLSGKADALVKVKGIGRSTAEILGSLDGDIRVHLRDAAVSHLAVEAAGLDVAGALGVFLKGDDAVPILCNVADLDVVKGVARPRVFVIDSKNSTVWIDGTVSLKTEALDLRAVTSPKDFSPFALRTPIHVRGTLGKPSVSLEKGMLAGKAGASVLLALLSPLAAIVPFVDPGSRDAAKEAADQCAALVKSSGAIAPAILTPKSLRVPATAASAPQRS